MISPPCFISNFQARPCDRAPNASPYAHESQLLWRCGVWCVVHFKEYDSHILGSLSQSQWGVFVLSSPGEGGVVTNSRLWMQTGARIFCVSGVYQLDTGGQRPAMCWSREI